MDRNFFTAIILSFLVLTLYQSLFVLPKRAKELKNAQNIQNNSFIEKKQELTTPSPENSIKTTKQDISEEITTLETTKIKVDFSNMGGSLHKISINGYEKSLPLKNMLTIKGFDQSVFSLDSKNDKEIIYSYSNSDWKIVKIFNITDENSISARIEITQNNISRLEELKFGTIRIDASNINQADNRNNMLDEFSILSAKNKIFRKDNAYKFSDKENRSSQESIKWAGFREHYHTVIIKPEFETKGYESNKVTESSLDINVIPAEDVSRGTPGKNTYEFTVLVGPQDIQWLKTYKKDFEKIVAFSGWGIIDIFAKGVYFAILMIQGVFKSWGVSIILISLLIYALTYPLTMKSMMSMKKMQTAQPQIAALQKKYKGDPQKLNSEMMALYKREGVNPLGGCLPFLLQMPVFMALYQVLWRAYYFQGKGFLWIKDLAFPDRLFILPFNLPFLGNEFNILPIVMGSVMFVQQKISSKSMVITDETQAMQQKMMKYFFPIFIGFIFYHFASGLSLYFTVFYALSAFTQWKITKKAV